MFALLGKKHWKMVCTSLLLLSLVGCSSDSNPQADSSAEPTASTSISPFISSEKPDWPEINGPANSRQKNWKLCGSMTELDKEITCIPHKDADEFIMRGSCYLDTDDSESEIDKIPPIYWSLYQNGKYLGAMGMDCENTAIPASISMMPEDFDPANGSLTIKVDQLPEGAQFRLVAGTVEHK